MTPVRRAAVGPTVESGGVKPEDIKTMDDETFRRAWATVLLRYASTFEGLAAHDRGDVDLDV